MSPTDAKKRSSVVAWRLAATAPCRLHTVVMLVKVCRMSSNLRHEHPALILWYSILFEGHLTSFTDLESRRIEHSHEHRRIPMMLFQCLGELVLNA